MLQLENMVAIKKEEGVKHIGHLFWYSIGDDLYQRDDLESTLITSGLSMGFMPNPIKSSDAFRRASKEVETRKKLGNGKYQNFLVRSVSSEKDFVERRIVKETVNSKGRRLSYNPMAAVMVLDKNTDTVSVSGSDTTALELAYEASRLFEIFKSHYNAHTIRFMTQAIIKTMSPTPVKPSGGIYFIPATYDEELQKLTKFCSTFSKSEGFKIVVVENEEAVKMVTTKVADHLDNIHSQCRSALQDGSLTKSRLSELLAEAKNVVAGYRDYEKIIVKQKEDIDTRIQLIRDSMSLLFDRVTND